MVATGSSFSLTQEKYDHLMTLLQQANLLSSASPPSEPVSNHINTSSFPDHSSGHVSQTGILSVISCSIKTNCDFWLLDSGANDHMCSSLSSFSSFYKIKPTYVNSPNGTSVIVDHAGNISFSPTYI